MISINQTEVFPVPDFSISIVSHRQAQLVQSLLDDLQHFCANDSVEIFLTVNVEEPLQFEPQEIFFAYLIRTSV